MQHEKGLRPHQASEYLKQHYNISHSADYLAWLRSRGGGPMFRHVGRFPEYAPAHLDQYARSRIGPVVSSTAEISTPAAA